jgi:hypothetical protein
MAIRGCSVPVPVAPIGGEDRSVFQEHLYPGWEIRRSKEFRGYHSRSTGLRHSYVTSHCDGGYAGVSVIFKRVHRIFERCVPNIFLIYERTQFTWLLVVIRSHGTIIASLQQKQTMIDLTAKVSQYHSLSLN